MAQHLGPKEQEAYKPVNRISKFYAVKDELDRPVLQDEDDDSSTELLDDLLESSDSVMQKDITRFQVNQQRRLQEYEATLYVWGDKQFQGGMDGKAIDNAIDVELIKFRQMLQYETQQYVIVMLQEKQTRDEAIGLFTMNQILSQK